MKSAAIAQEAASFFGCSLPGIVLIWLAGFRDYRLTAYLVKHANPDAELNPLARLLIEAAGRDGLAILKFGALTTLTISAGLIRRKSPRAAERLIIAGVAVSIALSIWWDICILPL